MGINQYSLTAQKRRNLIADMLMCSKVPISYDEFADAVAKAGLGTSGTPDKYSKDSFTDDLLVIRRSRNIEIRHFRNGGYVCATNYVAPPVEKKQHSHPRGAYEQKPKREPEAPTAARKPDVAPGMSIAEVVAEARKLGLSYGQYLVKIKTEKEGWNHGK